MKKTLLIIAGFLLLAIGAIGVIIPVLPTTPFVLLAGFCFARSNLPLYERLKRTPFIGEFIRHYSEKSGVTVKARISAIVFLWIGMIISMLVAQNRLVSWILFAIGLAVSLHLVLLKGARLERAEEKMIAVIEEEEATYDG
jgi:uncharacterized membrane protein YbaN (DUF454 family)